MLYSLSHRVLQSYNSSVYSSIDRTHPAPAVPYRMSFDRTHISCMPRTAIAAVLQDVLTLQLMILPERFDIVPLD